MNAPLRVYVSASMQSVLQLHQGVHPLDDFSSDKLFDGIPGVLPLGHLFAGRPAKSAVTSAMKGLIPRADVVFAWLEDFTADFLQGLEIGYAYAVGTPIVVSAAGGHLLQSFSGISRSQGVAGGIKRAYDSLMADADMFKRDFWENQVALIESICVSCGCRVETKSAIYMNRQGEVCHNDCYVRFKELKGPHEAVFNSELVAALRAENARLEVEVSRLSSRP